ELLRELHGMVEVRWGVRRARLNDYLQQLGPDAVDFAVALQRSTEYDVFRLCDNLPGVAAWLAMYRMIEVGGLLRTEGVELLRRALEDLPSSWVDDVAAMVTGPPVVQTTRPAVEAQVEPAASTATALLRVGARSIEGGRLLIVGFAHRVWSWQRKLTAAGEAGGWAAMCSAPMRDLLSR
ncbi:MAG: hypothetical protein ACOC46_01145, partial [Pirellulales bacterium]